MKSLILGTTGNFSIELQKKIPENSRIMIDRNHFEIWSRSSSKRELINRFSKFQATHLFYTIGITSPSESLSSLRSINFELPRYLYSLCRELEINLVTLGSIHENYPNLFLNNNYISVKKELNHFLCQNQYKNSYHVQFHTWYGGKKLKSDMFLGQIVTSLRNKSIFTMSSGQQVREYHHIEDDVVCLLKKLNSLNNGCYNISHGEFLTLRELATHVFKHFKMEHLLKIDIVKSDEDDVMSLERFKLINCQCYFRPSLEGVIKYIESKI